MPARRESLAITNLYQQRLIALRNAAVALIAESWRLVDFDDIVATGKTWLAAALAIVTGAQNEAVRTSDVYLAAYISSELGTQTAVQGVDPAAYAGKTRDGRPIEQVLQLALVSTFIAIRRRRPAQEALGSGLARAIRAGRTEVMEAARWSLGDLMQSDDRIRGYRRVITSANPCGACLALASGVRRTNKALEIHPSCRCIAEPVIGGIGETIHRPTGREIVQGMSSEQLAGLFAGRGGATKAELVKSGAVKLEDLVKRGTQPEWGQVITETPLEELLVF